MATRTRAVRAEDKLERRHEILDAAERLFRTRPEALASMDELAAAAGVAKGTLYLYFPSKEEVLVGLHERHMAAFFDKLQAALDSKRPFTVEDLLALGRKEIIEQPVRLSLGSLVIGLTERAVPPQSALAFKMHLGQSLLAAGEALDARFGLPAGESTRLLNASYALAVGLWQLKGCMGTERYKHLLDPKLARAFVAEYPAEATAAIRTLWENAIEKRPS
ncbi:MAG TPA: TetR/AcrR family transcriptional regulator [Burkholderiales bacterium]|nr:TetR/AcrR family transcriptional regulator [Burkholderiales bacterium]